MALPVVSQRTHPRALILEPTRELAIQVKNHLLAAAKHTDISVSSNTARGQKYLSPRFLKKAKGILLLPPSVGPSVRYAISS